MEKEVSRDIVSEIIMVVLGTALIILSVNASLSSRGIELDESEVKTINDACIKLDDLGNYQDDNITCYSNVCYLNIDDSFIATDCNSEKTKVVSKEYYNDLIKASDNVIKYCNRVDDNGLYLDQNNDYCVDGICYLRYNDTIIKYECPDVLKVEEKVDMNETTKERLQELCKAYKDKNYLSDDELEKCSYGTCKIINEKTKGADVIRCDEGKYLIMNDDDTFDDDVITKYLNMSCNKENIEEKRYNDNIKCGNGICSFHYKQNDYFKLCNQKVS